MTLRAARIPRTVCCERRTHHAVLKRDLKMFIGLFDVPLTRTPVGSRAFPGTGKTAKNNVLPTILHIPSAAAVKRHLKAHLVNCAHIT